MCRLLIITGELKRGQVLRLIEETACKFAPSQRDGFGFTTFNKLGNLTARGRYFEKYTGWDNPRSTSQVKEEGRIGSRTHTLIIHGRTSTNVVGVDYCHPFKCDDVILAHNGVLTYRGPHSQRPKHRNDSAAFLEWMTGQDERPSLKDCSKNWSGYGALAIMRPGEGLSIIKCSDARLAMVPRIGSGYVLATSSWDIPERLYRGESGIKHVGSCGLQFHPNSGKVERVVDFKGFGYQAWDERATKAMGTRTNLTGASQSDLFKR